MKNEKDTSGKIAASDESSGDSIGRYRLIKLIGEGAWGTVWLAEQTEDINRKVALKILKLGLDTKDFLSRFEAERQMMAMMDHSNIATILDAGATEYGRPYLVMELVDGMPLLTYADENRMKLEDRVELFVDICQALHHAHEKGIIHRDIKPSNILIAEQDGKPIPKIIDFGIAKTNQFQLSDKTLFTNIHTFIGTPLYSSPEQLEFCGMEVDPRSDVYSLGALLYMFLVGRTGFDLQSLSDWGMDQLRTVLMTEDPPLPSARFASLPAGTQQDLASNRGVTPGRAHALLKGDLDWIVMKSLEKDRNRRYSSARELAEDLQAFLDYRPVSAAAPGVLYRTRKYLQRHGLDRNAKILIPAALLCLLGMVFFYFGKKDTTAVFLGNASGTLNTISGESIAKASIAVLPFENLSKGEDRFLADGFHSELTATLSRRSGITTLSRNATLPFRDSSKSSQIIGQALRVAYLLSGTVERIDDSIRITVQLVDTSGNENLWSNSYVRVFEIEKLFGMQNEICRSIAIQISSILKPGETQDGQKIPTQNLEALQAYLQAKEIVDRDIGTRIVEALELLEKAVDLDPDFTLAYVVLGHAYRNNALSEFSDLSWEQRSLKMNEAARTAMELDDTLPEVHVLEGVIRLADRDREVAQASFQQALALDPNHADAVFYLAQTKSASGATASERKTALTDKLNRVARAIELDPKNSTYRFYIVNLLSALGRKTEMLEHYRAAASNNPSSYMAQNWLGLHYLREYGRFDQLIVYQRKAISINPKVVQFAANIRDAYEHLGGFEEAAEWTLIEQGIASHLAPLYKANLFRFRGEEERAIRAYRDAMAYYKANEPGQYIQGRRILFSYDLRHSKFSEALERYQKTAGKLFEKGAEIKSQALLESALDIAALLQVKGDATQSAHLIQEALDFTLNSGRGTDKNYYLALIHSLKGEANEALHSLRTAVDNGFRNRTLLADARLDPLRNYPDFIAILDIVESDMAKQLADIRRLEANGELAPIPKPSD